MAIPQSAMVPVRELTFATQQQWHGRPFPLAVQSTHTETNLAATCEWIRQESGHFTELAAEHGAVLFRDFPIRTPDDFDQFIQAFGYENFPYAESLSNAVRINITERVFTANEAPAEVHIFLHHEMAQTPIFPSRLLFYCDKAADTGGETPLCRSDILWQLIQREQPDFAQTCHDKGLLYTTIMPGHDDAGSGLGRSWQSTFAVQQRSEAEAHLQELGYSWEWQDDGCLKATSPNLAGWRRADSGRVSFLISSSLPSKAGKTAATTHVRR